MSASPLPAPFLVHSNRDPRSRAVSPPDAQSRGPRLVRRRPDRNQGRALEVLGHALEYLVDTRMFVLREPNSKADGESIQILSRCSREVFSTCVEVVPLRQRLKAWLGQHLFGGLHSLGDAANKA